MNSRGTFCFFEVYRFFMIFIFLERNLFEHINRKFSLNSKPQNCSICSFRIHSRTQDIFKKTFFWFWSFLFRLFKGWQFCFKRGWYCVRSTQNQSPNLIRYFFADHWTQANRWKIFWRSLGSLTTFNFFMSFAGTCFALCMYKETTCYLKFRFFFALNVSLELCLEI